MRPILLDERLTRVAGMVPKCRVCADIGADHGFLSAWLLGEGRVERMYICDISAPSLDKARRLFAGDALEERAVFAVGDGLERVTEPLDACVISGMGGETMMGILERGWDCVRGAELILQPNVDADRLRAFLYARGFEIADEELIFDGKWWYTILRARPANGDAALSDAEMLAGPVLLERRHPLLPEYARRQVRILRGALTDIDPGLERAALLRHRLEVWEEIAAWQK